MRQKLLQPSLGFDGCCEQFDNIMRRIQLYWKNVVNCHQFRYQDTVPFDVFIHYPVQGHHGFLSFIFFQVYVEYNFLSYSLKLSFVECIHSHHNSKTKTFYSEVKFQDGTLPANKKLSNSNSITLKVCPSALSSTYLAIPTYENAAQVLVSMRIKSF